MRYPATQNSSRMPGSPKIIPSANGGQTAGNIVKSAPNFWVCAASAERGSSKRATRSFKADGSPVKPARDALFVLQTPGAGSPSPSTAIDGALRRRG
jgi:hypothetical protein